MKFKMPRNLMAAVSVVAFAALLSSCGGGGGGDPVAAMRHKTTTPPTPPAAGPMIAGETIPSGTDGHIAAQALTTSRRHIQSQAMGETVTFSRYEGNVIVSVRVSADVGCSVDVTDDDQ